MLDTYNKMSKSKQQKEETLIRNRLNCKIYYKNNRAKMLLQVSIQRGLRSLESRLAKIWFKRGLISICKFNKVGRPKGTLRGKKLREKKIKIPKTREQKLEYCRLYYIANREKLLGIANEKRRVERMVKAQVPV